MLKNLEIINELHERLIKKGLKLRKISFCLYYTYEINSSIKLEVLLSFEDADVIFTQAHRKLNYIFSESDCMNKILNKVDEWMRK